VPPAFTDTARALSTDPMAWLLAGGEDHALAACFPREVDLPMAWQIIGRVSEGEGVLVDGQTYAGPAGWRSF
jgi:thiamine-monophosphate kinase